MHLPRFLFNEKPIKKRTKIKAKQIFTHTFPVTSIFLFGRFEVEAIKWGENRENLMFSFTCQTKIRTLNAEFTKTNSILESIYKFCRKNLFCENLR